MMRARRRAAAGANHRIGRSGLVYLSALGATAAVAWLLSGSLYVLTVSALTASAVVLAGETLFIFASPRIAFVCRRFMPLAWYRAAATAVTAIVSMGLGVLMVFLAT
jgi:hypothetical protein